MGFWIFMLVMNLILPFIMIIFGKIFMNRPPKDINYIYGYRSTRSMKNQETWIYAHNYCGRLWVRVGWIILIPTIISMLLVIDNGNQSVGTIGGVVSIVQLVILMGTIFPVERALKKNFDNDGNRSYRIVEQNESN